MNDTILSSKDMNRLFKELAKIGKILDSSSCELADFEKTSISLFEILDWMRTVCRYNKMDVEACRREMQVLRNHIDSEPKE